MFGMTRFGDHATLFGRMAQRHGVDWERVAGVAGDVALRRAVGACMACRDTEACRSLPDAAAPPAYCPNDAQFREWAGRDSAG